MAVAQVQGTVVCQVNINNTASEKDFPIVLEKSFFLVHYLHSFTKPMTFHT